MKCINCAHFFAPTDDRGHQIGDAQCQYHYEDGYSPCEIDDAIAELEPAEIEEFWT